MYTVKLCAQCVYTPEDLGKHYDPTAEQFCCGRCPAQGLLCVARGPYHREWVNRHYPERTNFYKRGGEYANTS